MALLTPTQAAPRQAEWLHWLYVRGNLAMSCDLEVRGERYVLTLLPLWSPEDQVMEIFRKPADAMRRHAEVTERLQKTGWLLVEGGPVTTAA
jgi:hypothetical protein